LSLQIAIKFNKSRPMWRPLFTDNRGLRSESSR